MSKINLRELALYTVGAGVIFGIGHAIFDPEPSVLRGFGYALFMGLALGCPMYFFEMRRKK
ncbi:hypothetical protein [Streptomyces sp. NPDC059169]|uniref:hypothetical protein n=1 Tax=unclassified Streptomyces TaxID=2593676 RepID=UPI0036CC0D41